MLLANLLRRLTGQSRRSSKRPPLWRPGLELLEGRDVPSGLTLTPLVQVSGPSPFASSPAPDIPRTDNSEVEPYLAADPTNPRHMVGAWIQDFARGIVAAVTFDAGATWREVPVPGLTISSGGTYPHSSDPWLSFAPNGDLYLSALGHDFPDFDNPHAILVSKSTDGGLTWGAPVTIAGGTSGLTDKPSITADPTNPRFAYATWVEFSQTGTVVTGKTMFSRTTDGGRTWEPARVISDPGPGNIDQYHQVVVLPDGTLTDFFTQIVPYVDSAGIPRADLYLSCIRSRNHGQSWTGLRGKSIPVAEILPVSNALFDLGSLVGPNNTLVRTGAEGFDVAADPTSGRLYTVWQDGRFSNSQYTSIAFSTSADGGLSWSAPIRVNQTPQGIRASDQQAFLPSVAVAANGAVAVTSYDFRNDTPGFGGVATDYWLVHAEATADLTNPVSWRDELRLTDRSFNLWDATAAPEGYFVGDYEGLVAFGNSFGALFSMPTKKDFDNVYFRDPPPAEAVAGSSVLGVGHPHPSTPLPDDGPVTGAPLSLGGSGPSLAAGAYFIDLAGTGQASSRDTGRDAPWQAFGPPSPALQRATDRFVPPPGGVTDTMTPVPALRAAGGLAEDWETDARLWADPLRDWEVATRLAD